MRLGVVRMLACMQSLVVYRVWCSPVIVKTQLANLHPIKAAGNSIFNIFMFSHFGYHTISALIQGIE